VADLTDDPTILLNVVLTVVLAVSLLVLVDCFSLNEAFLRGEGLGPSK
jgi:hypothetical protein